MESLQSSILISIACLGLLGAVRVKGITVFHQALQTLSIGLICAHSPQAKGRVARNLRVLQDRPIKEMRLRNISLIEEANHYLDEEFIEVHNKQFGKAAKDSQNEHRPLNPKEDLAKILATRSERYISKSLSIQYNNQIYQLQAETPNRLRYKKVIVIERSGKSFLMEKLRPFRGFYLKLNLRKSTNSLLSLRADPYLIANMLKSFVLHQFKPAYLP